MRIIHDEHPVELGQPVLLNDEEAQLYPTLFGSTIIAWGYYTDGTLSIMVLIHDNLRIANEQNYATFQVDHCDALGSIFAHPTLYDVRWFANIGHATDDWRDTRGLDW